MSSKTIERVDDEYYDGESPVGSRRDGYVTYEETNEILCQAIQNFVEHDETWLATKPTWPYYPQNEPILLTVHHCWSGYSEYTITSTWDEITIKWGDYERHFEDMGKFFTALALAAEQSPDY